MLSRYTNILSDTTIDSILSLEVVNLSLLQLEKTNNVYFEIPLNSAIIDELTNVLDIDLNGISKIPMRWVKGDTPAHIDKQHNSSIFNKTYLIYLTNSPGSLVIESEEYQISKNTAYVFSEGVYHETRDTNNIPRLLIGPMSENIVAVGAPSNTYIAQPGSSTIYIQQNGNDVTYSLDQNNWQTIYWPCYIANNSSSPFKGFLFTGLGARDLLTKLENFVVVANTNNIADLKIYRSQTFDSLNPNFFIEANSPDFTERADDNDNLVASIGTGSGTVMVNNMVLPNFSGNGHVGEWNYGIRFPAADFDYNSSGDLDACMNVWRDSDRFHIRLYRVELFPDGTNAEVTIDMLYKFNTSDVYIKVSGIQNFSNETNSISAFFGIHSQSYDENTDPSILKIDISTLDFNNVDGLPFYNAIGISGETLRIAGFSDNQLITAGYTVDGSNIPIADYLKVKFVSDITLNSTNCFFICLSEKIQFGLTSLNNDGSRPTIFITASNYDGLIYNGDQNSNGFSNIRIYNLFVSGVSTQIGGGWICKKYFGNGAVNNYIVNCSSAGDINGGGIVGDYAAANSGQLYIIGSSSSGAIQQQGAGGIVGQYAGSSNGSLYINSCWSSGIISGNNAGGIAGSNTNNATIVNTYSTGSISGAYSGGIAGFNAGNDSCTISNCYSTGNIFSNYSGGIAGPIDSLSNITLTIINCYYTGTIGNVVSSGAITGPINTSTSGSLNIIVNHAYASGAISTSDGYIIGGLNQENFIYNQSTKSILCDNCYSEFNRNSNNSWVSTHANTVLVGTPLDRLGNNWFSTGINQPYKIKDMGYSPYVTNNIVNNSLVRNTSSSIVAGSVLSSGNYFNNYSIIDISGGNVSSYNSINIDSLTGVISTASGTIAGTYTIYVYSEGSYNLSIYTITVSAIPCLIDSTMVLTPNGYVSVKYLKQNDYITTSDRREVKINYIFSSEISDPNETLYPCRIEKNSIAANYPPNDLYISQNHLIYYNHCWILPRLFYPLDTTRKTIKYYHIKLDNYNTDHLVIDNGVVVESLASSLEECSEYLNRVKLSVELYNMITCKNSSL